jgi:arylsulfatase A-like enzyme
MPARVGWRLGAAALLATAPSACGAEPPAPRSVLLIVVDTLRADHLGVYGYARPTTPRLDRFAAAGVVFDRAFSTSSWTVPAIASLLTGLPPSAHGGGFEVEGAEHLWQRTAVNEGVVTLTQRLRRRGYRTVALLSNPFLHPRFGLRRGFEDYHLYKREQGADYAVDVALEWIGRRGDEPFFMLLHFLEPHAPYAPPAPHRGRFTGDRELRPIEPLRRRRERAEEYTEADRRHLVGVYDEEIVALDERLGRLFEGLGERWNDTLVVFTSDHGEELLDHGSFDHGHTLMQELLHVPLVVWSPRLEARRVDTPVSLADVTPTILEALGLSAPELDAPGSGVSLWALAGGATAAARRDLLAEGLLFGGPAEALVRWPYKLVVDPSGGDRQLFDLATDPTEGRDLAAELPVIAGEMERRLALAVGHSSGRRGRPAREASPAADAELTALGYVN